MIYAIGRFSMAHQWRSAVCAIDESAYRKNQWRIGAPLAFPHWRIKGGVACADGATTVEALGSNRDAFVNSSLATTALKYHGMPATSLVWRSCRRPGGGWIDRVPRKWIMPQISPRMSPGQAVFALHEARHARASAEAYSGYDLEWTAAQFRHANVLEAQADDALIPREPLIEGRGGEIIDPDDTGPVRSPPNLLHAEASQERLALIGSKTALALDTAEALGASNSAEKMLGHQLAKSHELAMRLAGQALRFASKAERADNLGTHAQATAANIEASRSANASARLMEAYQKGLLTLDALRNGRKQVVTVQYINVTDGGQAVVAGSVKPHRSGE